LAVAWVQVIPSVEYQTSLLLLLASAPPITHILLSNTTDVSPDLADHWALAVAWVQVICALSVPIKIKISNITLYLYIISP
jgi:hypothetical protein